MTLISRSTLVTRSTFSGRYRMDPSIAALPRLRTGSWGLRDYGTGEWEGGDEDCDHLKGRPAGEPKDPTSTLESRASNQNHEREGFKDVCGKCGARRVDRQLGLEPTPDQYVTNMVAVFREVRRVLADHGTCWVNLGDSYNNRVGTKLSSHQRGLGFDSDDLQKSWVDLKAEGRTRMSIEDGVMKEKDLCGIPWRVAFALQTDGWYLRSDIIWSKPNPMPESVTDRPTKAHEYLFLLTKRPRYFFDQEAVREPLGDTSMAQIDYARRNGSRSDYLTKGMDVSRNDGNGLLARRGRGARGEAMNPAGRNVRSVWEIATQPYPDAHFATFPLELPRRCVAAGCPEWVCRSCGKPRERIVEIVEPGRALNPALAQARRDSVGESLGRTQTSGGVVPAVTRTTGWSDCGHNNYRPGVVLDPFLGSGTTAIAARNQGRHTIGIELNPEYAELAAKRTRQLSLLAEGLA